MPVAPPPSLPWRSSTMSTTHTPGISAASAAGAEVGLPQKLVDPFANWTRSPFAAFDYGSSKFYRHVVDPGLVAVSASTGNFKTFLMTNATAYALMDGDKVAILSMEMQRHRILERLVRILTDTPQGQNVDASGYRHCEELIEKRLFLHDASSKQITADQIGRMVDSSLTAGVRVLIIDGLETVKKERPGAQSLIEAVDLLAHKAAGSGVAVLFSSQLNRDAEGREVATLSNLSAASEKGQRPDRVVIIGKRDSNLLTVQFGKERDAQGDQQVYRLDVNPSLRLTVIEGGDINPAVGNATTPEPMFVNMADGDMPSGQTPDAVPESEDDDASAVYEPAMRPYHGTTGFVPVGRAVFASPMFTAREADNVLRLMDIYGMAQFEAAVLSAPRTTQKVSLKRGEVMASLTTLAKRWNVKKKVVRTFLKAASRDGLIRVEVLDADGVRRPQGSIKGTSLGASSGTRRKAVCQIVTCLHYEGNAPPSKTSKPKKGT